MRKTFVGQLASIGAIVFVSARFALAPDSIPDPIIAQCRNEAVMAVPRSEAQDELAVISASDNPALSFGSDRARNMLRDLDRQLEQDRADYTRNCIMAAKTGKE